MVTVEDAIKLTAIKQRHAYLDKKSKERSTGRIKPKYKLAAIQLHELGEYLFFVFTSDSDACKTRFLFTVTDDHWENKVAGATLPLSYCDPTKHEWLKQTELLAKLNDHLNGFPYVARLCIAKYRELQAIVKKASKDKYVSEQIIKIVHKGMLNAIDDLATKLGIA